jgi:hypothetical protein
MRIAICFSGQPRFVEECYPAIKSNLIDANKQHDVDIFVHTWFSEDICDKPLYANEFSSFSGGATIKSDVIDRIKELYSPVSIIVDGPISTTPTEKVYSNFIKWAMNGKNDFGMTPEDFQIRKTDSAYSIYYSIMQSNTQKQLNEIKKGYKYDVVVKMRFDNKINHPLTFDNIDMDFVYSDEIGKPNYEISDWINFSSSDRMDKVSSIFQNFDDVVGFSVRNYGGWSAESLIKSVCEMNGINSRTLHLGSRIPSWGRI